jgi:type I restriction enzyme S subunit
MQGELLRDLLVTSKDGDWGEDAPRRDLVPYRVIRGADFPAVRLGETSGIPLRYLDARTVHRRTLLPNDIIIETAGGNRDRPTGRTLFVSERLARSTDHPLTCASFCRFLRVDPKKAVPAYVFWYLQSLYACGHMWQHQVQHTGVARFQYTKFAESTSIPLPDSHTQSTVSDLLNALDQKIELNRTANETLEKIARTLFKSWFVGIDDQNIQKDWSLLQLGELCEVGRGASPRPIQQYMGGTIPWIKIADATAADGPFIFETAEHVTEQGAEKSVHVLPGDLILSNSATCGLPVFADLEGFIHDGWLYFRNLRLISKLYLYHVLKEISEHLVQIADGSVQKNLNTGLVKSQQVIVPPEHLLAVFDDAVKPMFDLIRDNGRQSRTLAALRDILLPKLIAGDVSLGQDESIVEAHV